MNIGVCFGGYCPLHQGHMDLIMRAKKENDITFVVVCDYDGEPRAEACDLPLLKRYRIIKNFLSDDFVKVIMVNDTELSIDESMIEENWAIWIGAVYTEMWKALDYCDIKGEVSWYVAESRYVNDIHNIVPEDKVILIDRTTMGMKE